MPDTYISQFSGEEIDSTLRAAQIISGASTPAELRKKLEIRGDTIPVSATDPTPISEALTTSGGGINPNLLDNWFFGRPVNQRGQMEYRGSTYSVDRWISPNSCSLVDGGLLITASAPGQIFTQRFPQEMQTALSGKTVTFSVLATIKSGVFCLTDTSGFSASHADMKMQTGVTSWTFPVANFNSISGLGWWGDRSGAQILAHAAKLELGSTQTLAHQDSSGNWILNEIPDFGEQLRRCQRYAFSPLYEAYATAVICNLFVSSVANGVAFGEVTLPVSMRNKPVFSGNASKFWIVAENGGGASHPTAISVMGLSADKVMIQVNGSYTANTQYILYVENPFTSADFLLSADL